MLDEADKQVVEINAGYADMHFPVVCDVSVRRRQKFIFPVGEELFWIWNGHKNKCVIDTNGVLTASKVSFDRPGKFILAFEAFSSGCRSKAAAG